MEAQSTSNITSGSSKEEIIKIITDEPTLEDALDFNNYSQRLASIITNSTPRFSIGIFGGWGTGKTSLMNMTRQILDGNNKVVTIWFDAWRYEREEYLAVIPFLRTVELRLDATKKDKAGDWEVVKNGVKRTLDAFLQSTKLSLGAKGMVSLEIDGKKVADVLKGDGTVGNDKDAIYYHVTDYLEKALKDLRKDDTDYRIVVFIDDLDRCSPEKALEVLESIKSFFDVEGFVYVIGMDSDTINSLVMKKYGGEESGIKGLYYLQKIVQLPFQIPTWKEIDISNSIGKIISKGLEGSDLIKEFEKNKELIVKAVELNPRQVKRFINNVIFAQAVFNKDIDKLIAVRALDFRDDWHKFLELITPNDTRKKFFEGYEKLKSLEGNGVKGITKNEELEEFAKGLPQTMIPSFRECSEIYQELIRKNSGKDLINFLDAGAAKILDTIKDMEEYRRALETTEHKPTEEKKRMIEKSELIALLHEGKVEKFNRIRRELLIMSPDLSNANLSNASLSNANLTYAHLSSANLSNAIVSDANLSNADLSHADLNNAILSNAILSNANLSNANLSHANLSNADLSHANLSSTILSNVILSNADLSNTKLINSVIIGAKEYGGLRCENADFSNAMIDDQTLADFLKSNGAVQIPPAVEDKKELQKKLQEKGLRR